MTRVLNLMTSSLAYSNAKATEAGASVIQCGPKWLFVSAISSPIDTGTLFELDEFTGDPKRVYNNSHTIAVGVPFTIPGTNEGITTTTAMDNDGNLFMYLNYKNNNPATIYRGVWNENLLRFENFQNFASFPTNSNYTGIYNTMAWGRSSYIYLVLNGNYVGAIDAFNPNTILRNLTNFSNAGWSPSSYSFSNGYYSEEGYVIGKSGNGTNWYAVQPSAGSSYYANPDSNYYTSAFVYGVSGIYGHYNAHLCHFSNFHKRMYYITNTLLSAYLFDASVFVNDRKKDISNKYVRETKDTVVPISEPTSIITSGQVEININNETSIKLNPGKQSYIYDTLVSSKHLFVLYANNDVVIINKEDITKSTPPLIEKNWSSQIPDNVLGLSGGAPTAYTIITSNNKDYFVGIHPTNGVVYRWEITNSGDLINQTTFNTSASSFGYYGRAAWDGGLYVYFIKNDGVVYRWQINSTAMNSPYTLNLSNVEMPSYTGCGAIVNNGLLYLSSSRNSPRQFILTIFDLGNGSYRTAIRSSQLVPASTYRMPTLYLYHNFNYAINIGATSLTLNSIKWVTPGNFSTSTPPLKQTLEAYDAIPYSTRTIGNKTFGPLMGKQVVNNLPSNVYVKYVFFGRYIYLYGSNHIVYIFNKNVDGTIGSFYTTTNWVSSWGSTLSSPVDNDFPITMYTENNVDKVVFFSYASPTTGGGTTLYEMILSSNGSYSTNNSYTHNVGSSSYVSGGFGKGAAAWDGSRYVYFINRSSLWRWDLLSKSNSMTLIKTIPVHINITYRGSSFMDTDNFYIQTGPYSFEKISLSKNPNILESSDEKIFLNNVERFFDYVGDYVSMGTTSLSFTEQSLFVNPQTPNLMFVVPLNNISSNKNIYYVDCTLRKEIVPLDVEIHNNIAKKENLLNVRDKVNEFRVNNGLTSRSWTDPNIVAGLSPIKAVHWNEITEAIDEVYSTQKISYNTPSVASKIQEVIVPKTPTYRITDLRSRLLAIIKALKNG